MCKATWLELYLHVTNNAFGEWIDTITNRTQTKYAHLVKKTTSKDRISIKHKY